MSTALNLPPDPDPSDPIGHHLAVANDPSLKAWQKAESVLYLIEHGQLCELPEAGSRPAVSTLEPYTPGLPPVNKAPLRVFTGGGPDRDRELERATRNPEAELGVLSGVIGDPAKLPDVLELLDVEDLHEPAVRLAYEAIRDRHRAGLAFDVVAVAEELKKSTAFVGLGGPALLDRAMEPSTADPIEHARIVRSRGIARRLLAAAQEVERDLVSGLDDAELVSRALGRFEPLAELHLRSDWDPPLLEGLVPADPFPLSALPPAMAGWIRTAAEVSFFPPDFLGLPCLAAAGAAIGRSVAVKLKEGWFEYPLIYSAIVGDPGSAKTPALKLASRPIWLLSQELLDDHRLLVEQGREAKRDRELQRKVRGTSSLASPDEADRVPPPQRIAVSDTTCEALALTLSENRRGLAMIQDELSGWLAGMNQYKGGSGNDRQFFLKVWSSSAIPIDRKGQADRIPIFLAEPFLAITGGIQPDVLDGLNFGDDRDDGFVDRILFSYPDPVPMGWSRASIPRDGIQAWDDAFRRLWDRKLLIDRNGEERPHVVGFTRSAERDFDAWCDAHCRETNSEHFPKHLKGPWRKLIVYAARLAIIVEQLRWAYEPGASPHQPPRPIGAETVAATVALLGYFKSHFRRVYASIKGGNSDNDLARSILGWIAKGGRAKFTEREVRDNFRRRLEEEPQHALETALLWLIQRQGIRKAPSVQKRGRPSTTLYDVNPYLRPKRAQKSEVAS